MFPIIGNKFPNRKVLTVLAKPSKAGLNPSPKAKAPKTSWKDAFIALKEPLRVVDASFAVVPVMSNSPCIT